MYPNLPVRLNKTIGGLTLGGAEIILELLLMRYSDIAMLKSLASQLQ
jgi:hypothetical protein